MVGGEEERVNGPTEELRGVMGNKGWISEVRGQTSGLLAKDQEQGAWRQESHSGFLPQRPL